MRKGLVGWLVGWGFWVEADAADSIIRRDCNRAGCTARKNGQARYPLGEKVRVIDGIQWFSCRKSFPGISMSRCVSGQVPNSPRVREGMKEGGKWKVQMVNEKEEEEKKEEDEKGNEG
ncbi:hypothetical protein V1477_014382 [Vespula maculifrons]|uniref:Secreted protein n=1 Tax=Vespula maculifrons TaxID=7453 RepID=A0ABD2BKW1_VESMC